MFKEELSPETANVIFESIKREEDFESDRSKHLDSKAVSLLGFSGLIASLTIGLSGFVFKDNLLLPFYQPFYLFSLLQLYYSSALQ
jgi:hypothetical protein